MALKELLKLKATIISIVVAVAFILIFFTIWMTAYKNLSSTTTNLRIGIVNEDKTIEKTVKKQLEKSLPYSVTSYSKLKTAQNKMEDRKLDMVVYIPKDFSEELQADKKVALQYFINQANSMLAKQTMEGVSRELTHTVNDNIYTYKQQLVKAGVQEQLAKEQLPDDMKTIISTSVEKAVESLSLTSVEGKVTKTNNSEGFAKTMIPLMVVLSAFVGSMIMSLNMESAAGSLKTRFSKWSIFGSRLVINFIAAVVLTFVSLGFLSVFNVDLQVSFLTAMMFQILVYYAFLSITQMFVMLFGPVGMLFNIILMSSQLVTAGVIVPKVMLSTFYQNYGSILPATYAADGYYSMVFGGNSMGPDMLKLFFIILVTVIVASVRVSISKNKKSG